MKKYWVVFIVVMAISISGFSTIVFKCFIEKPKPQFVLLKTAYLNTADIKEVHNFILDSVAGPGIISIFPCGHVNSKNEAIPWADLYVCKSFSKQDSLTGDTNLVLLDTHTKDLINVGDPTIYWAGVKAEKRSDICKVIVPANEVDSLKKHNYRYKYCQVTLITDDNNK